MSLNHNASIVTNGLVMYYDMANTQKSWLGAPVTNAATTPDNLSSNRTDTTACGSSFTDFSIGGPINNGAFVRVTRVGIAQSGDWPFSFSYPYTVGAQFQFSCYARCINGTVRTLAATNPDASGSASSLVLTPQWQRYSTTFTSGVQGGLQFLRINRSNTDTNTVGSIYDVACAQIEPYTFASPYTNSTRTTAQAVADLTSNNAITATSLTYVNDGTFRFNDNASGNYMDCGNASALQITGAITIDAWVKPTTYSSVGNIVSKNFNSGYRFRLDSTGSLWWYVSGNALQGGTVALNTWAHVTVSGSNTGLSAYINGVLVAANNTAYTPTSAGTSNLYVGCGIPGSETFNGTIASVKIYKRALTADEIAQNFNAQRSRYGL